MKGQEKIDLLTNYYLNLDAELEALSLQEIVMQLKVMLLHVRDRTGIDMDALLAHLGGGYEEHVVANESKTTEEIHQMLLDELARQEEMAQ